MSAYFFMHESTCVSLVLNKVVLFFFRNLNMLAFVKILKKFDKVSEMVVRFFLFYLCFHRHMYHDYYTYNREIGFRNFS